MGDVLSLVEEAQQKVDQDKVAKLAGKISRGKRFDMGDFRDQLEQMQNMGGLTSLMDKLPGMGQVPKEAMAMADDGQIRRMVAIINSMTEQERRFPDVIKGSRRRRIAAGSGTQVQDVNRLLKQYIQMRKMMKKMSKGGMSKMLRGMKGRLPPGGMPFQG
jgi:signal recognition particle subunit SRP54